MKIKPLIFESDISEIKNIINTLKSFRFYEDIEKYAISNFRLIGKSEHSTREVYQMNNGLVLKIDLTGRQNQNEVRAKQCIDDLFATKIYDFDKSYFYWIIAEKVNPIRSVEEFRTALLEKLEGSDSSIIDSIKDAEKDVTEEDRENGDYFSLAEIFNGILENVMGNHKNYATRVNKWVLTLAKGLKRCGVKPNQVDLHEENWGKRDNGELVILDLGYF